MRMIYQYRLLAYHVISRKRVLHDAHHGFVGLSTDAVLSHSHEAGAFCGCSLALWNVKVHLVSIEVGIVWSCDHEKMRNV